MELATLKNIGATMTKKLNVVDIHSAEQLISLGSKEAFGRLKAVYPEVCLVHLYSLQGAIDNKDYNKLSEETKKELKAFNDSLRSNV